MTQLLPDPENPTGARPALHIVVSCTNTKRHRPSPSLMVRNLPPGPVRPRVREWIRRLDKADSPRWAAADLYAGDHWASAVRLPNLGAKHGYTTHLWVLSAGYGLVPAHRPVSSYAATFSGSSADSVGTGAEALIWWDVLTTASELDGGHSRSLTELATADPSARIMLVASPTYLHPVAADATKAARLLDVHHNLMVISAGAHSTGTGLTPLLVPIDSRLAPLVGGSRISLNARTAALVLEHASEMDVNRTSVSDFLASRLVDLPPPPVYNRTPMTDDEVIEYVYGRLIEDPNLSATRLLRDLRERGHACEQRRFHDVVRQVKESHV